MKALTIWQPWASLLACGEKKFETRSWATFYRGSIAIHAAALNPLRFFNNGTIDDVTSIEMWKALEGSGIRCCADIPLGSVVATAELIGCHEIVLHGGRGLSSTSPGWLETENGIYEPTDRESMFGDWTHGRYAWEFTNMKMIVPTPVKGRQGLWNWEGEYL